MLKKIILSAFLPACAVMVFAKDLQTNFDKVSVASVYDGDTFKVNLDCEFSVFCNAISVRVAGIDTPEIKTKDGCEKRAAKKAKAFTQTFLKGKNVELKNCKRDKYFRLLCDVFADGKNLAEEILNAGLAVPYDGGTKQKTDWCKTNLVKEPYDKTPRQNSLNR